MANKTLFKTGRPVPTVNTLNRAGAPAYQFDDRNALAQLVVTSCFNNTFYAKAEDQLNEVLELARKVDSEFVCKAAIYSRKNALMKDTGVVLLAVLASRDDGARYFKIAFPHIIDNVKQLCNFARVIRSGIAGRRNFGHSVRNTINEWINSQDPSRLVKGAIGQSNPSLADVIKMVHTKPSDQRMSNVLAYLIDKKYDVDRLPDDIAYFERFKKDGGVNAPNMPFRALTNCGLTKDHWVQIGKDMPWNTLRMNLNMLGRNDVFADKTIVRQLASKLGSKEEVQKAKVFPYQIMTAYQNIDSTIPRELVDALHDALEYSTENVPEFGGDVVVAVDVSGSMGSPITGYSSAHHSNTTCVDVASLFACCILRKNPNALILPFDYSVKPVKLEPRDSVLTNAARIPAHGGGTNCTSVLEYLNRNRTKADYVIYFSDNASWAEYYANRWYGGSGNASPMLEAWNKFKANNKNAKLVLVDLQAYTNTQVPNSKDVLNVGGWNDSVFNVIHNFLYEKQDFAATVDQIELK